MELKKILARLIAITTAVIAVIALGFAVFAMWAAGKPASQLTHNSLVRLLVRPLRFRDGLSNRHPRCTVSDAWRLSSWNEFLSEEEIRQSFRVIRVDGPLSLVGTPAGTFWMPSRDIHAAAEMVQDQREGIYQPGVFGARSGDIVLDCGANIGVYTRYALSIGAARVVAIEVAPEDIDCLRRNFASEMAAGRVTVYPKGVWDKDATLQLHSDPAYSSMANSVAMGTGSAGPAVPLTTIDKIVAELRLPRVDFIKMDIEGAEPNALQGAMKTVNRFRPRLAIALEHRPSDPDTIPPLVKSQWPFYDIKLSTCAELSNGHLQPNVLYAHPKE